MSAQSKKTVSIIDTLHNRELGRDKSYKRNDSFIMVPGIEKRLGESFNDIATHIKALRSAIEAVKLADIQYALRMIFSKIMESYIPEQSCLSLERKQQREVFVALGGMHLLLRLFEKPFSEPDGRSMPASVVNRHSELWNECLMILREVSYSIPTLSEQLFGDKHIVFLFTLLVHRSVFENCVSLLEEILAVRIDTFSLALIPDLFVLIAKFSARQLGHFCRVLSLVLFEPEDRQIMDGSQVLRSLELLQLRRDRMAKASSIVERNQCLVIEMPDLLGRLLTLMRVTNYGPNLKDLARFNISAQDYPGNAELLQFISVDNSASEWDHLSSLITTVKKAETSGELRNSSQSTSVDDSASITSGRTTVESAPTSRNGFRTEESNAFMLDLSVDDTLAELLSAFAPSADLDGQGPMDLSALMNVVQIAQSLGLTAIAPDGLPIPSSENEGFSRLNAVRRGPVAPPTPLAAKKELQFHAMFLTPHHVELLFVLCTLLSGRRKINVQQQLASLGMADIILDMYDRLSWDSQAFIRHNPMEHVHGPGCDCNPESALRVQYLRLVHNFYDRDFIGNSNKTLLLSATEKQLLARCSSPEEVSKEGFFISNSEKGIFTRILHTLLKEPVESVYRFWLSSCLESFLRGSCPAEQVFIAISGILSNTVNHIVDMGMRASPNVNLQTAFDLLGELVKGNYATIEMVDSALGERNFIRFIDVVLSNLVDSNVFLRSLYLTIDVFNDSESDVGRQRQEKTLKPAALGYLSHSWTHCDPKVLSKKAVDVIKMRKTLSSGSRDARKIAQPIKRWMGIGQQGPIVLEHRVMQNTSPTSSSMSARPSSRRGTDRYRSTEVEEATTTLPVASPRRTHSVRGTLQNIREAASHFLSFSSPSPVQRNGVLVESAEQKRAAAVALKAERLKQTEFVRHNETQLLGTVSSSGGNENRDLEGDLECDYDEFFTPPEAPHYTRASSKSATSICTAASKLTDDSKLVSLVQPISNLSISSEIPNVDSTDAMMTVESEIEAKMASNYPVESIRSRGETERVDQPSSSSKAATAATPSSPPQLPKSLYRFRSFLRDERDYILLRLMSTVTMYSINHENICCLNTALLILLLANKRGQLARLLHRVRCLAESQSPLHNNTTNSLFKKQESQTSASSPDPIPLVGRTSSTVVSSSSSASVANGSSIRHDRQEQHSCTEDLSAVGSEADSEGTKACRNEQFEGCINCVEGTLEALSPVSLKGIKENDVIRKHLVSYPSISLFPAEITKGVRSDDKKVDETSSNNSNDSDKPSIDNVKRPHDEQNYNLNGEQEEGQSRTAEKETATHDNRHQGERAERLMVNFRELLWYWREYYLRRGRDRLSIEFSSHIPFFQWNQLVDTLCQDNGCPTSLVAAPMKLPMSPYHRPSLSHNSSSTEFIRYGPQSDSSPPDSISADVAL